MQMELEPYKEAEASGPQGQLRGYVEVFLGAVVREPSSAGQPDLFGRWLRDRATWYKEFGLSGTPDCSRPATSLMIGDHIRKFPRPIFWRLCFCAADQPAQTLDVDALRLALVGLRPYSRDRRANRIEVMPEPKFVPKLVHEYSPCRSLAVPPPGCARTIQ